MSEMTFKEAYGVLQKHSDALRQQREPNIDELLTIVEESVAAYKTCKDRIAAVDAALAKALGEVDGDGRQAETLRPVPISRHGPQDDQAGG